LPNSKPASKNPKLAHEIKRIVTRSPKLTGESLEELEAALIAADLGMPVTQQIVAAVTRLRIPGHRHDVFAIAPPNLKRISSNKPDLLKAPSGPTVVSIVGVNGTGKTTTSAKLAHLIQSQKKAALLAACDTFRAAAIEQLKLWGTRLKVEVIAGAYGADAASVAHDAVTAAQARKADYLSLTPRAACTPSTTSCRSYTNFIASSASNCPGRRTKSCSCSTAAPA
jgi:fused signal recognition particle receptor